MSQCFSWGAATLETFERAEYGVAAGVRKSTGISSLTATQSVKVDVIVTGADPASYVNVEEAEIASAIADLRAALTDALGPAVVGFSTERISPKDDEDLGEFVALVARVSQVPRERRRELRAELSRRIAQSPSRAVRERVVLNFR